jgi:hypothetical protein
MQITFKILGFILLLVSFHSCNGNKEEDTIKLEDIRPKAENKEDKASETTIDSTIMIIKTYKSDSFDLKVSRLEFMKATTFLSRFPNKENGLRNLIGEDTTKVFNHEYYIYKDSTQMKNAFFNWLDCNGTECISIKLYDECKIDAINNLMVVCTNNSIDIIRSLKTIKPEDWISFVRFSRKSKDIKYIIYQKKNQKAKWLDFKDFKLVPKKTK